MASTLYVLGKQLLVELERLSGRPGLAKSQLTAELTLQPRSDLDGALLLVDGSAQAVVDGAGMRYLGHASSRGDAPWFVRTADGEPLTARLTICVDFSDIQLEAFEDWRRGRALELYLDMKGVVVQAGNMIPLSGQLNYRIEAETFARVLDQMGYATSVILNVPLDHPHASDTYREAASRLRQLLLIAAQGDYRRAVRECRDLLEAVFAPLDKQYAEFRPKFPNVHNATKEARFYLVREALRQVANAAAHEDEVAQAIQWTREDAQAVIGALAAVLIALR